MLTEQFTATGTPQEIVEQLMQPIAEHRIYFGGGLFTDQEKEFNLRLTGQLERLGFIVFLPQRDGYEAATLDTWSDEEKTLRIYRRDLVEVCRAQYLFANLNGAIPDDGLCGEVNIAGMHKLINPSKRIIGYRSDTRSFMGTLRLNPLIAGPLDLLCSSIDEVTRYFSAHTPAAPGDSSSTGSA